MILKIYYLNDNRYAFDHDELELPDDFYTNAELDRFARDYGRAHHPMGECGMMRWEVKRSEAF